MSNEFKLNIKKSPIDDRDLIAETIFHDANDNIPKELDYRKDLLLVRNQGKQSACAGEASACMKEWQERKDINYIEYMSPQFIYNNRENKNSEGMYSRDVMKILNKTGIVPEKDYPYNTFNEITEELKAKASKYRIKGYAYINTIDGLKKALVMNGPCYFAVPVYNYGNRMWKPKQGDTRHGSHAMTCVGYNKEGFIIRNSWGFFWGDKGYTIFPYEDWGLQLEVWTTIDEESGKPLPPPKKENFFMYYFNLIKGYIKYNF